MHIGILGGGPSALFLYKHLVEGNPHDLEITIIEKNNRLGAGMPYSPDGANVEHVTNVSDNEIPELVTSISEWIRTASHQLLQPFDMVPEKFNEYKVVPRLLFGEYLAAQFDFLLLQAKKAGIKTKVLLNTSLTDIIDDPSNKSVKVLTDKGGTLQFDAVVLCTGHNWPKKHEGKVPRYFDSPYPPSKLALQVNYPVAIRGASLTAFDALRTLARSNGVFEKKEDGLLTYHLNKGSEEFRIVMHSIDGLLPGIRFHLEDPTISKKSVLTETAINDIKAENDGFVPLDILFEKNFKDGICEEDPAFYEMIKDMSIETFVTHVMSRRERLDAFVLFKAEYAEAEKSIRRKQSIYWKEMLASLSFAMNYPAKHLSAEDMLRLKKVLMPLIAIVIAFVPQSSCRELLALYEAGVLSLVPVDKDSEVVPREEGGIVYKLTDEQDKSQSTPYNLFVDCIGQPHLQFKDFPFNSLRENGSISPARLKFKSKETGAKALRDGKQQVDLDATLEYYLHVPGIAINDHFQVLDQYGSYIERIYIMAVPYIGGFNPDYSGLDFCEAASAKITNSLVFALTDLSDR